jgi:hypothetical protein
MISWPQSAPRSGPVLLLGPPGLASQPGPRSHPPDHRTTGTRLSPPMTPGSRAKWPRTDLPWDLPPQPVLTREGFGALSAQHARLPKSTNWQELAIRAAGEFAKWRAGALGSAMDSHPG